MSSDTQTTPHAHPFNAADPDAVADAVAEPGDRLRALAVRRSTAADPATPEADARHRANGKLAARKRLELLLDPGSLTELRPFAEHRTTRFGMDRAHPPGDGVVTGWGTVDGRTVVVFAHDARVYGGALGEVFAQKIHQVTDLAESIGAPVIGLNDGRRCKLTLPSTAGGAPRPATPSPRARKVTSRFRPRTAHEHGSDRTRFPAGTDQIRR